MKIGKYSIETYGAPFMVAELSANHGHKLEKALETIRAAKWAGAHAIKIQTYTADTMTIPSHKEPFQIRGGTAWDGMSLHELYQQAYTPWEWHETLQKEAHEQGLEFFSTPFDISAVDFLESLNVPAYKIASFELVDLPLIRRVAKTKKPIILSTGMGSLEEIHEAIDTARSAGAKDICLLKCTSAYPAPATSINLRAMQELHRQFEVPVGLSDHTMGSAVATAAVALGACMVEKHFIVSRTEKGPDSSFSMEPQEFQEMVKSVNIAASALGKPDIGPTDDERSMFRFRRSLFVVKDIKKGEMFTHDNIRSIRPSSGLPPKFMDEVLGKRAECDLTTGTPMSWEMISMITKSNEPTPRK